MTPFLWSLAHSLRKLRFIYEKLQIEPIAATTATLPIRRLHRLGHPRVHRSDADLPVMIDQRTEHSIEGYEKLLKEIRRIPE